MIPLTAQQIVDATQGTLVGCGPQTRISDVSTDSREKREQSLFIAIRGDNSDGHAHLQQAYENGAFLAIVHDAANAEGRAHILVNDTRLAMGKLANFVRRQFTKTRVIAVAGSNGKTGTKHLIHSVLKTKLRGSMSPKSFNNDIGVPLTLFAVAHEDDYVVVEVGTNHPGEVKHLSLMCEPDIAVITSIGEEHMEFFRTLDGVRQENADIIAGLRPGGFVLINGDDPALRSMLPDAATFGFSECDYVARDVRSTLEGTYFVAATPASPFSPGQILGDAGVAATIPQIGRYHASNALVAIAIGQHFGLSNDQIRQGLATASSPEMRMQKRFIGGITILNDAYNANPTSVCAALKTLDEIDWPGRKIIVLGEMRELGDASAQAHLEMKKLACDQSSAHAHFVGNAYHPADRWYADSDTAAVAIAPTLQHNDLVLIKGSRAIKMERIEQAIEARFIK